MLHNVTTTPPRRALEFGIYRDGDNNLDAVQNAVLGQALQTSARDPRIAFAIEDTTGLNVAHGDVVEGKLHTDSFDLAGGRIGDPHVGRAQDMSDPKNLAGFVAHTLDQAEANGAKQTWIDLVDHGGGDGGGLQTHDGRCMAMPDIAKAIAEGVALHAKAHPEDAGRGVDGVVANQCLMDTLGFADALSHVGVKYLAASPETMLAPGVPSTVAHAIAANASDPGAMAGAVVNDVMRTKYDAGPLGAFGPAAAFDVLDLDPQKVAAMTAHVKALNDALVAAASDPNARAAIRDDFRSVPGMTRDPALQAQHLPWTADRPAMAAYDALARDGRLDAGVRGKADAAAQSVRDLVMAHKESSDFAPFHGADYADAAGPTVHLPTAPNQVDPWAKHGISETDNAFYRGTDGDALAHVIA